MMKKIFLVLGLFFTTSVIAGMPADTPIWKAVASNNQVEVEQLVRQGLDKKNLDYGLVAAVVNNNKKAAQVLIKAGADTNHNILAGHTPVILAVRRNNTDILITLLKNGGNPNVSDSLEWQPLHHAIKKNKQTTRQSLFY